MTNSNKIFMDTITTAIINALSAFNKDDINDSYNALKLALKEKFGSNSDVVNAVEGLEYKPYSKGRQTTLQEEIETAAVNEDFEIVQLAQNLLHQLQNQPEKFSISGLANNITTKSNKSSRSRQIKLSGLLLIIPLITTAIGGYILFKKIQANADIRIIRECETKEFCSGRIDALERLVKANQSLQSYNLERANLESTNLAGADFENANLTGASLESADLNGASLYRADLSRANLNSVNLHNVDFTNSNLEGADFNGADFDGSYFNNANLDRTILNRVKNLSFSRIKSTCNWQKALYKADWDQENSKWIVDDIANKTYIEEITQDKASDPKQKPDCRSWKK